MTAERQPVRKTFTSQRQELSYVDWGNASAPPLVMVHGRGDHCRSWDWTARKLAPNWHVMAVDLAGHGDSSWVSNGHYTMAGFVFDLAELIRQVTAEPVTLIGHSLGGNICLRHAGTYPDTVARLVSVEGFGLSAQKMAKTAGQAVPERLREWIENKRLVIGQARRMYNTFDDAVARMMEANKRLSPERARHLAEHGVRQREDGLLHWKFDPLIGAWHASDLPHSEVEEIWRAITCPVLLIYGTESWHTDPSRDGRAQNFADHRVAAIEGASHWVHHDRFDQFMTRVESFLAETA